MINRRIKVLAILPAIIPSSVILVVEPLIYLVGLGKAELRICLEHLYVRAADIKWADLIVFCRNTEPTYAAILEQVLALKKPYIYELDDNFFELPSELAVADYHRAPSQIAQLEKYIKNASLVRVYSLPLENRVRQYTSRVKTAKTPVNLSSIPRVAPLRKDRKLKLLYTTSRTDGDNLSEIFVQDIVRLLEEYGDSVEVHFWGFLPEELKGFSSVKFHKFKMNYKKYFQAIYNEAYDIGLAPMKNDVFHNSKTNNKFREYGASWIAGIYSHGGLYGGCVEDKVTGLLVSNENGEWYSAIVKLIQNVDLRQFIQENARSVVEKEYSLDTFSLLLLDDINRLLSEDQVRVDLGKSSLPIAASKDARTNTSFSRIFVLPFALFNKVRKSVKKNGCKATLKNVREKLNQYQEYFFLILKIHGNKKL